MKAFWLALGFLSWIPTPHFMADDRDLGRAVALFPVVGAGFGALLWGALAASHGRLPDAVVGELLVALLAALSGGLHLDGLADTFDAVGASAKPDPAARREKMLAVMRDPRTGAHGAAALVVVLGLKAAALGALAPGPALILGPALARWTASLLVVAFPYARPEGLGRVFKEQARPGAVALTGAALLGAAALTGALAGAALATGGALALAAWVNRRLGGLTGDVYGAAVELAEALFFVALTAAI